LRGTVRPTTANVCLLFGRFTKMLPCDVSLLLGLRLHLLLLVVFGCGRAGEADAVFKDFLNIVHSRNKLLFIKLIFKVFKLFDIFVFLLVG